ncbi:MAG: hypothetical protein ACK56I_09850 [bacterium]
MRGRPSTSAMRRMCAATALRALPRTSRPREARSSSRRTGSISGSLKKSAPSACGSKRTMIACTSLPVFSS